MTAFYVITVSAVVMLTLAGLANVMGDREGLGAFLLIMALAVGVVVFGVSISQAEAAARRDYQLMCVDANAIVVNETNCERETQPSSFWLWIGPPVTPVPAERTPAPPTGVLIDCTNEDLWDDLGLDAETADLPPNGTVRQAHQDTLREWGVLR